MKQQDFSAAPSKVVGMDVHKRTIAFCALTRSAGILKKLGYPFAMVITTGIAVQF